MIDTEWGRRLARIGLSDTLHQRLAPWWSDLQRPDAATQLMRVAEVQRETLALHDGAQTHEARALPALLDSLAALDDALAVGDWVVVTRNRHGQWWVHDRVPPLTQLGRRLHDGRDKVSRAVFVSNVDTALLVMGLDHDFNVRRLERYLTLVRLSGVGAVVVLTKRDACADWASRQAEVQAVLPADAAAVALDARGDEPAQALAPWLEPGRTLVLLGSSGAGKSTLTNALIGQAVQSTGGVREGDGRGRHTTTVRSLHLLPGGACIVDTPGVRTLRLDADAGDVTAAFDDIARLAPQCRFRDCRHEQEPGCAVRPALDPARLRNYQKLRREAERDTLSVLQRREQLSAWKQRSRETRHVMRLKRGDA